MSVRTMARVWEHSRHSGSDLLMLLAIADFTDDDGKAYPSVATLAAKCRVIPRTANRTIAKLRDSGELIVQLGEGPKGTNLYLIPPLPPGVDATPGTDATLAPTPAPPGVHVPLPLASTPDDPSLIHQRSIKSTDRTKRDQTDHFERWYSSYPKKVGRGQAEKTFTKLNPSASLVDQMIAAVESQKIARGRLQAAGEWVPEWKNPATWLNGKCWLDEIQAAQEPARPSERPVRYQENIY